MSELPGRFVLDASVGVKLLVSEDHSATVQALLDPLRLAQEDFVLVPCLFYAECANVLWKRVRRDGYLPELALRGLIRLVSLRLPTIPTSDLVADALAIACRYGVSVYDACYLALSERKRIPLLTADHKLAEVLQAAPFQIAVLT